MAHQRSIAAFRAEMGPHYDFSALWDKHCEYEFAVRDVDAAQRRRCIDQLAGRHVEAVVAQPFGEGD